MRLGSSGSWEYLGQRGGASAGVKVSAVSDLLVNRFGNLSRVPAHRPCACARMRHMRKFAAERFRTLESSQRSGSELLKVGIHPGTRAFLARIPA